MNALLVIASLLPFADDADGQLLLKQLFGNAEQTSARLQKEGARWTTRHDLPGGAAAEVVVEQFPQVSRLELKLVGGGRSDKIVSVIVREGEWLVDDGESRSRYRPFEAPFVIPSSVYFLTNSDLQLLTKEALNGPVVNVEAQGDRRVIVRTRGSDLQRENLRALVTKMEELRDQLKAAGRPAPPDQQRLIDDLKERLSNGFPSVIDRETGILLDRGMPPKEVHYRGFAWKGADETPTWDLSSKRWTDRTKTFSAEEMRDVIMIGNSQVWQPGTRAGDTDLMLLNVRTSQVKRVPFPFGIAISGCFSKDRTKVYVPGTKLDEGNLSLFEVNLITGQTTGLGDDRLRRGMWLGPTLSPDERYLAAAQILQGQGISSQIHVVDLQSSQSKPIGEPMDVAFLMWHPNGRSLFCVLREPDPGSEFQKSFIAEITLDGKTRKIRESTFPCLLPTTQRFLFKDDADERKWKTCDLDGTDVRPFGDGFKGFGFPAPSPDGRLLMMKFEQGKGPQPCLIDLETYKVTRIAVGPGLWASPAWK